jgi:hypothetical protein
VSARAGGLLALAVAALGGARPAAAAPAELTGVVLDAAGAPLPAADVVVSDSRGRVRRAAVADGDGRFQLQVADPGAYRVTVYAGDGAVVATRVLEVADGQRIQLALPVAGAGARAWADGVGDQLPLPAAASPGLKAPAAGWDLTAALVAVPGTTPAAAPADGPVLAGTDPAEVQLQLAGLRLDDPADGRAPWELPASLFGAMVPALGLGPAADRPTGKAGVQLRAARAERASAGGRVTPGLAAGAGEAQGSERPRGVTVGGEVLAWASAVSTDGRWRGTLAAAPVRGGWRADPTSVNGPRGRRLTVVPVLGRADVDAGPWSFAVTGLGATFARTHGRTGPVVVSGEPGRWSQRLGALAVDGRRPLAFSPWWTSELTLHGGLAGWWRAQHDALGDEVDTRASRATLAAGASTAGTLGGRHWLRASAGLEAERARRTGGAGTRQADAAVTRARASSLSPFVGADERYAPVPWLELEAGLRLQTVRLEGRGERAAGDTLVRSFRTRGLLAPRFALALRPPPVRARWHTRLEIVAGRFPGPVPLAPLLGGAAAPRFGLGTPAEDAALASAEVGTAAVRLGVTAVARRAVHVVEDRFSPADGQLELFEPSGLRRRYRALGASLSGRTGHWRTAAALTRSSLRGNHDGATDTVLGLPRPGATGAWDTRALEANREGPLVYDRPWSARLLVEHARPVAPGYRLALVIAGRLDSGTPLSARGRSADSGEGEVFLVERGSLGRTGTVTAVDAGAALAWAAPGRRTALTTVALQVANLGNQRPVIARDGIYTRAAAAPIAGGRGRADLGRVTDAAGGPITPQPAFGNPVAWAEPPSLRLSLTVEM